MATISKEDYIKTIFELSDQENKAVKPSEIAKSLSVSKPAITDMIKKLVRDGYVSKNKLSEILLTAKGYELSVMLIRKHRIWEMFMHEVLKMSWEEIHEEAEKLEHATSDYLINKIDDYLGNPIYDPHGTPIPDKKGNIKSEKLYKKLSQKERGTYSVKRIEDKERDFIETLNKLGISINSTIEIIKKMSFDDSLLINVNNREHIITSKLGERIFVL
jgi:DtxR family Mn-dependent transcriptional regulator